MPGNNNIVCLCVRKYFINTTKYEYVKVYGFK